MARPVRVLSCERTGPPPRPCHHPCLWHRAPTTNTVGKRTRLRNGAHEGKRRIVMAWCSNAGGARRTCGTKGLFVVQGVGRRPTGPFQGIMGWSFTLCSELARSHPQIVICMYVYHSSTKPLLRPAHAAPAAGPSSPVLALTLCRIRKGSFVRSRYASNKGALLGILSFNVLAMVQGQLGGCVYSGVA